MNVEVIQRVEGEVILHLTPREAFVLKRIIGNTNYDIAFKSCNNYSDLPDEAKISYEECRDVLYTIYDSIKLSFDDNA
jgi:hypothetical protein